MTTAYAIETCGLTKRYGRTLAVDDLTIRVEPGEIYGFLGLNGAGKSTTIRMLLGMARPSRGAVYLFGNKVSSGRGPWTRVGYLVDAAHAYPGLTVRENLELARRLHGVTDPGAVDRSLESLGIAAYRDRRAGALSYGNAQRLGLAKALLHQPDLLILDEPAGGLDPEGIVELRELLRGLVRERGVAIFMSSHILAEVARLATHVAVIDGGRLLAEFDAKTLERRARRRLLVDARDRAAARQALEAHGFPVSGDGDHGLALDDGRALEHPEHVVSVLVAASVPPTSLHLWREDLEAVFLRLLDENRGAAA